MHKHSIPESAESAESIMVFHQNVHNSKHLWIILVIMVIIIIITIITITDKHSIVPHKVQCALRNTGHSPATREMPRHGERRQHTTVATRAACVQRRRTWSLGLHERTVETGKQEKCLLDWPSRLAGAPSPFTWLALVALCEGDGASPHRRLTAFGGANGGSRDLVARAIS